MGKLISLEEKRIVSGVTIQLTVQELATITEAIGQTNASIIRDKHKASSIENIKYEDLLISNSDLYDFLCDTYKEAKK